MRDAASPIAYVTNMFGGTLWTATWDAAKKDFTVAQVFDFASIKAGVPLEIYFTSKDGKADQLHVTTASPGTCTTRKVDSCRGSWLTMQ